ncbi:hypothetical protein BDR03DRAFT_58673 [Suillus americanus]|nr:hypothetical protein BDR03DRAFT_58673 [Suillus americanus]
MTFVLCMQPHIASLRSYNHFSFRSYFVIYLRSFKFPATFFRGESILFFLEYIHNAEYFVINHCNGVESMAQQAVAIPVNLGATSGFFCHWHEQAGGKPLQKPTQHYEDGSLQAHLSVRGRLSTCQSYRGYCVRASCHWKGHLQAFPCFG